MSEFSEVPSVVRQGELVREIGQELVRGLPGGWVKAVYDRKQLVSYGEDLCFLTDEHGQVSREWAPRPVEKLVDELRAVMYKSGAGTWYSMEYTIDIVDGRANGSTSFNYEDMPAWDMTPVPLTFVEDLQEFPRDPQHIPAWLTEQIELARVEHPDAVTRLNTTFYREISYHPDGYNIWGGLFRRENNDRKTDAVFKGGRDRRWHDTGRLWVALTGGRQKVRQISARQARAYLDERWGLGHRLHQMKIDDRYEKDPSTRPDTYIPVADRPGMEGWDE